MELPPTLTFDYPTTAAISAFIAEAVAPAAAEAPEAFVDVGAASVLPSSALQPLSRERNQALAVTGVSVRLAGGIDGLPTLHATLVAAPELQTAGPYARWDADTLYSPAGGIGRVSSRFGTYVHSTYQFDAKAFGLAGERGGGAAPSGAHVVEHEV